MLKQKLNVSLGLWTINYRVNGSGNVILCRCLLYIRDYFKHVGVRDRYEFMTNTESPTIHSQNSHYPHLSVIIKARF